MPRDSYLTTCMTEADCPWKPREVPPGGSKFKLEVEHDHIEALKRLKRIKRPDIKAVAIVFLNLKT